MLSRETYRRLVSFILTLVILLTTVTSSIAPVYAAEKEEIVEDIKLEEEIEEEINEELNQPESEEVEESIIQEEADDKISEDILENTLLKQSIEAFSSTTKEVTTWEGFKQAYNNSSVERIELGADIITDNIKGLSARTSPLVIYGGRGSEATSQKPYYLLDIGINELPLGKPNTSLQEFRLENLEISNLHKSYTTLKGGFLNLEYDHLKGYDWTLYFKNIKNPKKRTDPKYADMIRFAIGRTSTFVFEGDIDVEMYLEYALPGKVLIKEGTNFTGNQHNIKDRDGGAWQHSAFWYNASSGLENNQRTFTVEDNVTINWTRSNTSNYPPIYSHYQSMNIGNNVNWDQDNFKYFLLNDATPYDKTVKFGSRNKIIATRSSDESISFYNTGNSYIEFGPGSSIIIESAKDLIKIGRSTQVIFRNPVGLDLESSSGNIFNIASGGRVDFRYVTMNAWTNNPPKDGNGNPTTKADGRFEKVIRTVGTNSSSRSVTMEDIDTSTDTQTKTRLQTYFGGANPSRITTEKIPIGKVAIQYVNHRTERPVGPEQIINLQEHYGHSDDYFMIDEELELTNKMKMTKSDNGYIPNGYRFATSADLGSKAQAEFIKTGMEGIVGEDPKVTKIYVHPENAEFKVNYKYVEDGKIVRTEIFSEENGALINLNTSKYTNYIYPGFRYAKDNELKPGQIQGKEVVVEKDKSYDIYIFKTDPKGGIWGRVIDKKTNEGVGKARVKVPGAQEEVMTDKNGYYLISGLDAGSYSVLVSHEEYNSTSDLLEVASDMVYKDFYIDKNTDNGGNQDRYLIFGKVEAVEGGISRPAKGGEVTSLEGKKGIVDSFGYYVINDLDGEKTYNLLASYTGFQVNLLRQQLKKKIRKLILSYMLVLQLML